MTELSRSSEPSRPRKYFWATMLVAFCDQVFGNSTPRCSKAGFAGIADHGVAKLPLDLVEGVHPRGRVAALAEQALRRLRFTVFAALSDILYLLFNRRF